MKLFLFIFITLLSVSGCTSSQLIEDVDFPEAVTPIELAIKYTQPSFDKDEQNSGILDFINEEGWLITDRALARYNGLIKKFGATFDPPILENYEVTIKYNPNKAIYLSQEGMVKFAIMNQKL